MNKREYYEIMRHLFEKRFGKDWDKTLTNREVLRALREDGTNSVINRTYKEAVYVFGLFGRHSGWHTTYNLYSYSERFANLKKHIA